MATSAPDEGITYEPDEKCSLALPQVDKLLADIAEGSGWDEAAAKWCK